MNFSLVSSHNWVGVTVSHVYRFLKDENTKERPCDYAGPNNSEVVRVGRELAVSASTPELAGATRKASFPCHMHRDTASVESVVHGDDFLGQRSCRDGIETRTVNKRCTKGALMKL